MTAADNCTQSFNFPIEHGRLAVAGNHKYIHDMLEVDSFGRGKKDHHFPLLLSFLNRLCLTSTFADEIGNGRKKEEGERKLLFWSVIDKRWRRGSS